MKRLLIFIVIILFITACNKRYTYVEVIRQQQMFGGTKVATKEEVKIRARSDTAAYLDAYQKYCISREVYLRMKNRLGSSELLDVPIGFKLYNSKGVDITNIKFTSKLEQEQKMEEKVNRISSEVFN